MDVKELQRYTSEARMLHDDASHFGIFGPQTRHIHDDSALRDLRASDHRTLAFLRLFVDMRTFRGYLSMLNNKYSHSWHTYCIFVVMSIHNILHVDADAGILHRLPLQRVNATM